MNLYYLNLVKMFAWTDFKLKYHGSVLGYFWSLLNPLLMFSVFYIVFSFFVRFKVENYHLFLFLGIILWGFFNEGTLNAITTLYAKAPITKKIFFPRTVIVVASNITTFIGLLLNFVVFFLFYFFSGLVVTPFSFFALLFLINLFFITLGSSYIVAALNLRFSDVQHIWRILIQLFFWLTPVVYPIMTVPEQLRHLLYFNPIALIIEGTRDLLLTSTLDMLYYLLSLGYALLVFLLGYFIYKKMSVRFAEWA